MTGIKLAGPPPGHNLPPLGLPGVVLRGLGWIGPYLTLSSDGCEKCVRQVTFKTEHAARHLDGTSLSPAEVEAAIRTHIQSIFTRPTSTGEFRGRVSVGEWMIQYHAYTLPSGVINVGTYYVPGL